MCPCGSVFVIRFFVSLMVSLWVFMSFYGSIGVLEGPHRSFYVLTRFYESLCMLRYSYGFL